MTPETYKVLVAGNASEYRAVVSSEARYYIDDFFIANCPNIETTLDFLRNAVSVGGKNIVWQFINEFVETHNDPRNFNLRRSVHLIAHASAAARYYNGDFKYKFYSPDDLLELALKEFYEMLNRMCKNGIISDENDDCKLIKHFIERVNTALGYTPLITVEG